MPKVLISDKMSPAAADIFKNRGIEVDVITGLSEDELVRRLVEEGRITLCNSAYAAMYGVTSADLIGRRAIDLFGAQCVYRRYCERRSTSGAIAN